MKKTVLILAAVLGVAATSCKKDYSCTCTTSGGGVSASATTTIRETKSKAKTACEKNNSEVMGVKTTCELK